jgi:hypothetical protein
LGPDCQWSSWRVAAVFGKATGTAIARLNIPAVFGKTVPASKCSSGLDAHDVGLHDYVVLTLEWPDYSLELVLCLIMPHLNKNSLKLTSSHQITHACAKYIFVKL